MKRENTLRKRLHSLLTLSDAIGAMKSLSAHHFRSARAALSAAHSYREGIDQAIAAIGLHQPQSSNNAVLLVAADLGLCGGYNAQLAEAGLDSCRRLAANRMYCVGHRPVTAFRRANVHIDRQYSAPTSVDGLTQLLLRLGEDLLVDYLSGAFGTLNVISARFDGVGEFTPVCTRLLPVDSPEPTPAIPPSDYVTADHLAAIAVREYLYIRLFQTALDSLASEHGAHLVATQSAGEWLSEKSSGARRSLAASRRETATQEVLDIAASAKRRKNRTAKR